MSETSKGQPVVGIVGLGSMGFGMGQSLLRGGLPTYGADVDAKRVAALQQAGARPGTLVEHAGELDILVLVVVNAAQVDDVLFGRDALASKLKAGVVVVGCPTVAPDYARGLGERLKEMGLLYLDAPISGGAVRAAEGNLTMMCSGEPAAFAAARPALDAMCETVFELGDAPGPGSAMKIVNQLLAGVHIAAAAEAITFGVSQGIDPKKTVEVISKSAGSSWMFQNRGPHIVEGDYTPRSAVSIFVKDLGIVTDVGRASHFALPLAATALQQFLAADGSGLGKEDDAAVAKVYARNAGLKLPGMD